MPNLAFDVVIFKSVGKSHWFKQRVFGLHVYGNFSSSLFGFSLLIKLCTVFESLGSTFSYLFEVDSLLIVGLVVQLQRLCELFTYTDTHIYVLRQIAKTAEGVIG